MDNNLKMWLLGITATVVGFILKYLGDYFWLNSPKIIIEGFVTPKAAHPPLGSDFRKYDYELKLEISNHSKNECYGLKILDIKFRDSFQIYKRDFLQKSSMITDSSPFYLSIPFSKTLNRIGKESLGAQERFGELHTSLKISLRYKNQLRKEYEKITHIDFKLGEGNKFSVN